MKKLVRKSVTWLLIFGMVFTPLVTSIDLVSANAEDGEISFTIGDSEYKFEENNLNDEAKNSVSAADTATKAAAAAEKAATDAETAAKNATASANTAAAAAGTDSNADTYKDSAIGIINGLTENLNNTSKENPGLVQQIEAANTAYNEATSKVNAANAAIAAADDLYQAALIAKRNASTKQEEAEAAILLANAEKAKTDAMKTLADAEGVQGNYLTKLHQLKELVTEADGLKTTADGLKTAASDNQTSVDQAVSNAETLINKSIAPFDSNDPAGSKKNNGIGYYDIWVGYATQKNQNAQDAITTANAALEAAEKEKAAAGKAIEDAKGNIDNFQTEVDALNTDIQEEVDQLLLEVDAKVSDETKFGMTAAEASEAALDAADKAKQKAIEWGAKAEAEAARAEADANAAQNGLFTESRDTLATYAAAAATAASNARTYADAAQEAANAAAQAEADALATYEYLKAIYNDANTMLGKASEEYNIELAKANKKVNGEDGESGINKEVRDANSLVNNFDNKTIDAVKKQIDNDSSDKKEWGANQIIADANNGHDSLQGAEDRANKTINDTRTAIATADEKVKEQDEKIKSAQTAIDNYNSKAKAVRDAIEAYEKAREYFNNELDKEGGSIKTYNAAVQAIKDANTEIAKAIKAMQDANDAIPDVSDAKTAYDEATRKIVAAATALAAAGTSLTNAESQTIAAETAAAEADGYAQTAAQEAARAALQTTDAENILAKQLTGKDTYQQLVDNQKDNQEKYEQALLDQTKKNAAALETKNAADAAALQTKSAADDAALQTKNAADAAAEQKQSTAKSGAKDTYDGIVQEQDGILNRYENYESTLNEAKSTIKNYNEEITCPYDDWQVTERESLSKYDIACALVKNGKVTFKVYYWFIPRSHTYTAKELGWTDEQAKKIKEEYEQAKTDESTIEGAKKAKEEALKAYTKACSEADSTCTTEKGAAQQAYNTSMGAALNTYNTAITNAKNQYDSAILKANNDYNAVINQTQNAVDAAYGNKQISDKELDAVNKFVATGSSSENTMVFTAEEAKLLEDLLSELSNGYYGKNGDDFDSSDYSYLAENSDTNTFRMMAGCTLASDFLGWLGNGIRNLFNKGDKYTENSVSTKNKLQDKYSSLNGFTHNPFKVDKKDDENISALVQITSDKCVLLCEDAEKIAVLKATLAAAKAEEAKKTANSKKEAANSAAIKARNALTTYQNALTELGNKLNLTEDELVKLNSEDIPIGFKLGTDSERGEDYILSYGDVKDYVTKPYHATTSANAGGKYDRSDIETITYNHTEYDGKKEEFEEEVKKFEANKIKNIKLKEDIDLIDLSEGSANGKLLSKLGLSLEEIKEREGLTFDNVLNDLEGIVAKAWENYLAAKKVAEDAQKEADKAEQAAIRANREAGRAKDALTYYDNFINYNPNTGDSTYVAAAGTGFTLPTAGAVLTGVAGVRRAIGGGRRVAAAGEGTGEEIKTDAGQPKLVPLEEEEVKEEEKAAEKTQKTTTIEEDPLPAAAAAPEKAPFPWWLLLIVVAALGAGYAGYKYYDKKKNEDKIA